MSVSWRHAARAAATAIAAIAAIALLPTLLRTPDPPPLDPDVGLTGLAEGAEPLPAPKREPRENSKGRGDRAASLKREERKRESGRTRAEAPKEDRGNHDDKAAPEPEHSPSPAPAPPPAQPPPVTTTASAPPPVAAPPPAPAPSPAAPAPTGPSPGVRQFGP